MGHCHFVQPNGIVVFDEVTAGLDQTNKTTVLNVIERLSETYIVVVISRDKLSLPRQKPYTVQLEQPISALRYSPNAKS